MTKDMKMDGVRVRARVSVGLWVCGRVPEASRRSHQSSMSSLPLYSF